MPYRIASRDRHIESELQEPVTSVAVAPACDPSISQSAIQHQKVERKEAGFGTKKQQVTKLGLAPFVQAHNLAVDDGLARFFKSIKRAEGFPLCEINSQRPLRITASERNPSYFSSEIQSGWSNGASLRESGIGWNAMRKSYQGRGRKVGEVELRFLPLGQGLQFVHDLPESLFLSLAQGLAMLVWY